MESSLALLGVWLSLFIPDSLAILEVDAWAVKSISQALASQNRPTTKCRHLHYSSESKLEQFAVACFCVRRLEQLGTDLLIGVLRTSSHRVESSGP